MTVGPLGFVANVAGTPLAQTKSTEDRAAQENSEQARTAQGSKNAEKAAGLGETEADQQAFERDADGRRPWEVGDARKGSGSEEKAEGEDAAARASRDPSGERGTQLDLSG